VQAQFFQDGHGSLLIAIRFEDGDFLLGDGHLSSVWNPIFSAAKPQIQEDQYPRNRHPQEHNFEVLRNDPRT
jgi:hypothetical protein